MKARRGWGLGFGCAVGLLMAGQAAADVVISSSDSNANSSVTNDGFMTFRAENNTHGVAFTVNQASTLQSIVANLEIEGYTTESLSAQLLELGTPENDQYGTPSYQYTSLATSSTISPTGNNQFADCEFSFSGQELDPGNTYLIFLDASLAQSEFADWEYTEASTALPTSYGSISLGIWQYTTAADSTSLVYDNVQQFAPEITIYADVPEPSTLIFPAIGMLFAGLSRRVRTRGAR